MIRFLNLLALVALIGSATAAYTVKYETILVAERLRKREAELQRERDAVAILKAEWQLLNRPQRVQALAAPLGAMQPLSMRQIVRAADIPQRGPEEDRIEDLLTGSIATPAVPKAAATRTPATPRAAGRTGAASTSAAPARAALARGANPRPGAPTRLTPPVNVGGPQVARAAPPPAAPASPSLLDRLRGVFR
ncbi:cell division protein FtsL [Rhabdaerophilum calidifontis]|uniref:cell division protein FtsL n=1 Tax=Rhabdaerophilum calidifontis TaxID=2604328 RepID=UPI001980C00E|nr:hypothetical protein [Rhabdaerophilum calidifontis]